MFSHNETSAKAGVLSYYVVVPDTIGSRNVRTFWLGILLKKQSFAGTNDFNITETSVGNTKLHSTFFTHITRVTAGFTFQFYKWIVCL